MRGSGKMMSKRVKVHLSGKMDELTLVNGERIRCMEMVSLLGLTVESFKASLRMEFKMEYLRTRRRQGNNGKVSGGMETIRNG